jgi:hypothetical protein
MGLPTIQEKQMTSRVKGKAYENQVAKQLRDIGFTNAKRHLEYQFQEALGRDLDGTQPFAIQCKCWKATPSIRAIEEIILDDEYYIPVAILKRTQSTKSKTLEVAVLPLDIFYKILKHLKEEEAAWSQEP